MNPSDISNLYAQGFYHVIFPAAFFLKCYYCLQKHKTNLSFTFFSHCNKHTERIKRLEVFHSIPSSLSLKGAETGQPMNQTSYEMQMEALLSMHSCVPANLPAGPLHSMV